MSDTNDKRVVQTGAPIGDQDSIDNKKDSQTENVSKSLEEKNSDIKIDGVYKMNIIGPTPNTIGLRSYDTNNVITQIGVVDCFQDKYGISGHFYYDSDSISGYEIGGNTSIFDKRIFQLYVYPNYPDKIDINKLVLVYFKRPTLQEAPQVVAYSKIVDMKHRMNNIQNIRFDGKVQSSDILIDAVAVIKENENYRLVSHSITYNVVGNIPKEMSDAAIKQPDGEFPAVDINKYFVVYLTSFTANKSVNGEETYSVKILTYSPVIGGEAVNMDEQGF